MDLASAPSGFGDVVSGHIPLTGGSFAYARGRVTSDEFRAWGWPDNVGAQQTTGSGRLNNTSPLGARAALAAFPGDLGAVMNIGGGLHVVNNASFAYSAAYNTAGTFFCLQNATSISAAFESGAIISDSRTGPSVNLPGVATIVGATTYVGQIAGTTITQTIGDILSAPAFIGTITATQISNFQAKTALASGAVVTTRKGFEMFDATGSGVVTQIGLDILPLAAGSFFNIGIRNASNTVYSPPARQIIAAAGNTILPAATCISLRNQSGASITLTSTPTVSTTNIADGQILIIKMSNSNLTSTVIVQSNGTLAGSALSLGATTRTLSRSGRSVSCGMPTSRSGSRPVSTEDSSRNGSRGSNGRAPTAARTAGRARSDAGHHQRRSAPTPGPHGLPQWLRPSSGRRRNRKRRHMNAKNLRLILGAVVSVYGVVASVDHAKGVHLPVAIAAVLTAVGPIMLGVQHWLSDPSTGTPAPQSVVTLSTSGQAAAVPVPQYSTIPPQPAPVAPPAPAAPSPAPAPLPDASLAPVAPPAPGG